MRPLESINTNLFYGVGEIVLKFSKTLPIFFPKASKYAAHFKSGQKGLENSHLASFTKVKSNP